MKRNHVPKITQRGFKIAFADLDGLSEPRVDLQGSWNFWRTS